MVSTQNASQHIVIVGGGITGLSAAWEIQQTTDENITFTVLEKSDRWGGKVVTQTIDHPSGEQFTIDAGPESFITRKPEAWELVQELEMDDQAIDPGSETQQIYVLDDGKPVAIPLSPPAFITSKLMTWHGKLRMLAEPFIPAKRDGEDESLAQFADRRLGIEAREKFIGPVLAGIYNTNPETQSILTTSPIMREMEAEYGGLFKGAFGRMRVARKEKKMGEPQKPRFVTFKNGAEELIARLVEKLDGDLRLNTGVTNITKNSTGYQVQLTDGTQLAADGVILTTMANVSAQILAEIASEAAAELVKIRHTNIGTISLAYDQAQITDLPFRGLMIPRREKRDIDAVTYTSAKLDIRAPKDCSLVRVFFGAGNPDTVHLDDDTLLATVKRELRELLDIQVEPSDYRVCRWPAEFPQADVGHLDRVDAIEAALPVGLYLAGSSYRGIGVPDCVRQGRDTALESIKNITQRRQVAKF